MNDIVNLIGNQLGIAPATMGFYLTLVILVAKVVARKIPDSATGWLGTVRQIAAVIGLHVKDNSGVAAIPTAAGTAIRREIETSLPAGEAVEVENAAKPIINAFQSAAETIQKESKE